MQACHKMGLGTVQHYLALLLVTICVAAETRNVHRRAEPVDSSVRDILMKGAKPQEPEAYLCASYPILDDKSFIYKFEALADASTVHHMLLYGCNGEPFSNDPIWKCDMMCKEGAQTILFSWGKNAPLTVLPEGVGLRIGKQSTIKTLVLQVHYAKAFNNKDSPDYSGLRIYTTNKEQPFVAGIYLLGGSFFVVPKGNPSYTVDASCDFNMEQSIFPFAYRAHAHSLGKVITAYLYNGSYYEIGKGNPQWPQAFYPVHDKIEVKPGDTLAARCTYDSTTIDHPVRVGSTGNDEMCNFYIMFYTDKSVRDPSGQCWDNSRPDITGNNFPSDVSVPLPPNPQLEAAAKGAHHHASPNEDFSPNSDTSTMDIVMKGAKPDAPDAYLCAAYPITDEEAYIYKFEALANASTAHHILVYGCDGEAYSNQPIWKCPPMCKNYKSTIMFAWAKNAPPTVLPKNVGLKIGRKSSIKTIVVQVHYAHPLSEGAAPDHSGIRIHITHQKQPFLAGIYLLASSAFSIPPGQSSYPVDVSCPFHLKKSIFPFAYRTHAHGLGKVITGYHHNGTFNQIGKGNPQWPQAFYPVNVSIEVKPGDYLAARCTYDSTSMSSQVSVGSTGNDEMCNFYIMFYTDSSMENPSGQCNGNAVSSLTGDHFPADVSEPLPPNPALEEAASGHHHHQAAGADHKMLNFRNSPRTTTHNHEQNQSSYMKMEDMDSLGTSRHGNTEERVQYDYDFDDMDSDMVLVQKRQKQEYYDEYAANDLRENGLYPPRAGGNTEEGRSRNRNKEFEAMNQQIQQFPRKNQRIRPGHQQVGIPQKQVLDVPGGGAAESKRPLNRKVETPLAEPGGNVLPEEPTKEFSRIYFEHKLEFNSSWPSEKVDLGQIGGVATDTSGNVYIFHRGSRKWTAQSFSYDNDFIDQNSPIQEDVIVILNSQGQLIRKFGAGQYFMPHGIEVDKDGNIWLTDVALHQVFKIPHGKTSPSLVLGHRFHHGSDLTSFCKPTDVAVLSTGEFFVSDGYCNGRVLKFSKNGTLIKTWGERQVFTIGPPPHGIFEIPHSITVSEENHLVCVADRENGRVQCFDLDGNFSHIIKHPEFGSRLFAVEQSPVQGGVLYAVNGPSYNGPTDTSVQGFTLDIRTGALLETWNIPEHLKNPHDISVHSASQSVYVGELKPEAVWKLSRHSPAVETATPGHVHIVKKPNEPIQTGNKVEEHTPASASKDKDADQMSSEMTGNKTSVVINTDLETEKVEATPAVLIGCLLVVPVILLLVIILFIRARHSGKLQCCKSSKKRVFSLQGILGNSHKGFDPLNTEESDRDSDGEEYMAPKKAKTKS